MRIRIFLVAMIGVIANYSLTQPSHAQSGAEMQFTPIAEFNRPWAFSFVPDQSILVTTKPGRLYHITPDGAPRLVAGVPKVYAGGQGGLGDVLPHPDFAENAWVYLSYVTSEDEGKTRFARVSRAKLQLNETPSLAEIETIWQQNIALTGQGHFSHRLAFGPKNSPHQGMLFITSGDRQAQTPAQDMSVNLGKIIRLHDDGSIPADNPYNAGPDIARSFWTIGHRNMLGIDFDDQGRLWAHEMGPQDGDELNLIERGKNYGWPIVSEGIHYNGQPIPSHETRPEFAAPKIAWVPTIAPSGLVIDGDHAWIGGLRSRALIKVDISGANPREVARYDMGRRIRDVDIDAKGALWVLGDGTSGRLLKGVTKP